MDDETLVAKLKLGNKEAFDMLYEKYSSRVLRTATLISGSLEDGKDITQETFVKIYLNISRLKTNAAFERWMYQILSRTAWHYCNKKKTEYASEDVLQIIDCNLDSTHEQDNPLAQAVRQDELEQLATAINLLPCKHRTVIVLYYYNELTIKEIAKILGCLEGTVKSRLFHARKQLREALEEVDHNEN